MFKYYVEYTNKNHRLFKDQLFDNVLLGINQGLAWSTAIIMKIDLIGPARRGLAMGLNETAGYAGVALASLATGYLAAVHGPRPAPFLLGIGFALLGLLLTLLLIRETHEHAKLEAVLAGVVADLFGFTPAIVAVGLLTTISGLVVAVRMRETLPQGRGAQ